MRAPVNLARVEHATAEAEKWKDEMSQLTSECASLLGRELTAYVGGADHTRELTRWLNRSDPSAVRARERLEAVRRIATLLDQSLGRARMLAWFRDLDPDLDNASPATAIRDSSVREVRSLVHAKAVRYASSPHNAVLAGSLR
jgi:hypothetical protein